jgi:hypothetical protein
LDGADLELVLDLSEGGVEVDAEWWGHIEALGRGGQFGAW